MRRQQTLAASERPWQTVNDDPISTTVKAVTLRRNITLRRAGQYLARWRLVLIHGSQIGQMKTKSRENDA